MSSVDASRRVERRVAIVLVALCLFVLIANLSTWKANVTFPQNAHTSAIAKMVNETFPQLDEIRAAGNLSLNQDDLKNRTAFPPGAQPNLQMPIANTPVIGHMDDVVKTPTGLRLRGWVFIPSGAESPEFVVAVENSKIVGALKVSENRPDVAKALNNKEALRTGYDGQINTTENMSGCNITLFALTSSLTLYPMPSACEKANVSNH